MSFSTPSFTVSSAPAPSGVRAPSAATVAANRINLFMTTLFPPVGVLGFRGRGYCIDRAAIAKPRRAAARWPDDPHRRLQIPPPLAGEGREGEARVLSVG